MAAETFRAKYLGKERKLRYNKKNGNCSVGLRRVCPSEARVLAALTVRKRGIGGKNPIAAGDFQWIFARNCEGTEQLRKMERIKGYES